MKKNLICTFTGKVKRKHKTQFDIVNNVGMKIDVFVNFEFDLGKEYVNFPNRIFQSKNNLLARLISVYSYLKKNNKTIHHMQLFSSGRFNIVYILFAKRFNIKILLVERGGMNQFIQKGGQDFLTKLSSWMLYKMADYTWYKEYYMKEHLDNLKVKNQYFIPNTIDDFKFDKIEKYSNRTIDYLWVNGVIKLRHVDWVIEIAKMPKFKRSSFEIHGFLEYSYSRKKFLKLNENLPTNVKLFPYQPNILHLMQRAKYFLLPADYVFGNYALIEAMARGAVPVVSAVVGVDKIIEDNVHGLTHKNEFDYFKGVMEKTLLMDKRKWEMMSKNSSDQIKMNFSRSSFENRLLNLYEKIK